jgi:soluble lytic murein transglycosylase-like protein
MRISMQIFLCAAAVAALAAPAAAQEKSRARAETQVITPFSFFRALFTPPTTLARVDRTNKESRLNVSAPRGAVWPQAGFGTRIEPEIPATGPRSSRGWDPAIEAGIARHAAAAGVPLELARRVVRRESNGNPRAVSKGNFGLMQIRLGTAQAMGYRGNAHGLLDADTNMTYAMKYLAGAYRAAGGNHDRAVALYARGYYYEAKAQGFSAYEPPRAAYAAFGPFGRALD